MKIEVNKGPVERSVKADENRLSTLCDGTQPIAKRDHGVLRDASGTREVLKCSADNLHCGRQQIIIQRLEFDIESGLRIVHGYRAKREHAVGWRERSGSFDVNRYVDFSHIISTVRYAIFTIGGLLMFFFQNSTKAFFLSATESPGFQKWHGIIS